MTDRHDYHEHSPHFDGEQEGIINAPEGPRMGIRIDIDPEKRQNPDPYHVGKNGLKQDGIEGFSSFFGGKKDNKK